MNLYTYIKEDITSTERQYRQFVNIINSYGVENIDDVEVKVTPKNNFAVYFGGKKICLLSNNIITVDVLKEHKIKVVK